MCGAVMHKGFEQCWKHGCISLRRHQILIQQFQCSLDFKDIQTTNIIVKLKSYYTSILSLRLSIKQASMTILILHLPLKDIISGSKSLPRHPSPVINLSGLLPTCILPICISYHYKNNTKWRHKDIQAYALNLQSSVPTPPLHTPFFSALEPSC